MNDSLSVSVRTRLNFAEALECVKQALRRAEFQIVTEVPFHRAFRRQFGLECEGYVALIVWLPFEAFRALMSDRDAGLIHPFAFIVAESGQGSTVSALNHESVQANSSSVAMQVLARELSKRTRQVFTELSAQERRLACEKAKDPAAQNNPQTEDILCPAKVKFG